MLWVMFCFYQSLFLLISASGHSFCLDCILILRGNSSEGATHGTGASSWFTGKAPLWWHNTPYKLLPRSSPRRSLFIYTILIKVPLPPSPSRALVLSYGRYTCILSCRWTRPTMVHLVDSPAVYSAAEFLARIPRDYQLRLAGLRRDKGRALSDEERRRAARGQLVSSSPSHPLPHPRRTWRAGLPLTPPPGRGLPTPARTRWAGHSRSSIQPPPEPLQPPDPPPMENHPPGRHPGLLQVPLRPRGGGPCLRDTAPRGRIPFLPGWSCAASEG